MIKYFSMFSGIGGFELGIQQAYDSLRPLQSENHNGPAELNSLADELEQWECVGYSEIDKYAIQIYERHFNHKNYGDATTINASELPDFDLLVGGFPCQAFSIAGKRLGLDDTRGTLFYDIARIAKEKRPQHLLLENVKGLLSHDNGRTFKLIISTFAELGYNLEWQVLNSKNFGVPQNRERVFIIGHLGECCGRQVFPLGEPSEVRDRPDEAEEEIYNVAQTLTARQFASWNGNYVAPNGKQIDLSQTPQEPFQLLETRTEKGKQTRRLIRQTEGRDSTLRGKDDKKYVPKTDGKANALTTGSAVIEKWLFDPDMRIRRLTPTECERLQGYPDGWTKYGLEFTKKVGDKIFFESDKNLLIEISDTQRYKTLGNSVTVNVIEEIIKRLYE